MQENVRTMWVSTAHHMGDVHLAMSAVTCSTSNSDNHIDVGPSSAARNCSDLQQLIDWLDVNDPFLTNDSCFRSLSTGLTATTEENITCDQADEIGFKIHQTMDGKNFVDLSMKKSEQVRTLAILKKSVSTRIYSFKIQTS